MKNSKRTSSLGDVNDDNSVVLSNSYEEDDADELKPLTNTHELKTSVKRISDLKISNDSPTKDIDYEDEQDEDDVLIEHDNNNDEINERERMNIAEDVEIEDPNDVNDQNNDIEVNEDNLEENENINYSNSYDANRNINELDNSDRFVNTKLRILVYLKLDINNIAEKPTLESRDKSTDKKIKDTQEFKEARDKFRESRQTRENETREENSNKNNLKNQEQENLDFDNRGDEDIKWDLGYKEELEVKIDKNRENRGRTEEIQTRTNDNEDFEDKWNDIENSKLKSHYYIKNKILYANNTNNTSLSKDKGNKKIKLIKDSKLLREIKPTTPHQPQPNIIYPKKLAVEKIQFPLDQPGKQEIKPSNTTSNLKKNIMNILDIEKNFRLNEDNNRYSQNNKITKTEISNNTSRDRVKDNFGDFISRKVELIEKCREDRKLSSDSISASSIHYHNRLFGEKPKFLRSFQINVNELTRSKSPKYQYPASLLKSHENENFSTSTLNGVFKTMNLKTNEDLIEKEQEQFIEHVANIPKKENLVEKFNSVFKIITTCPAIKHNVKNKRHTLDNLGENFDSTLSRIYNKKLVKSINPYDYQGFNNSRLGTLEKNANLQSVSSFNTSSLSHMNNVNKDNREFNKEVTKENNKGNKNDILVKSDINSETSIKDKEDYYCESKIDNLLNKYKKGDKLDRDKSIVIDNSIYDINSKKGLIYHYDKKYIDSIKIHGNYSTEGNNYSITSSGQPHIPNALPYDPHHNPEPIFKPKSQQTDTKPIKPLNTFTPSAIKSSNFSNLTQLFKINKLNISKEFNTNKKDNMRESMNQLSSTNIGNSNDLSSFYNDKNKKISDNIFNSLNYSQALHSKNLKTLEGNTSMTRNNFDDIKKIVIKTSTEKISTLMKTQKAMETI